MDNAKSPSFSSPIVFVAPSHRPMPPRDYFVVEDCRTDWDFRICGRMKGSQDAFALMVVTIRATSLAYAIDLLRAAYELHAEIPAEA